MDPNAAPYQMLTVSYVDAQLAATDLTADEITLVEAHRERIQQSRQVRAAARPVRLTIELRHHALARSFRSPLSWHESQAVVVALPRPAPCAWPLGGPDVLVFDSHRLPACQRDRLPPDIAPVHCQGVAMQAAVSQLGERPKEEASAQAWDMHYNAMDAAAHEAAAREYPDADTQHAWERYLHREQLLVLRDQLIQYGGARLCRPAC